MRSDWDDAPEHLRSRKKQGPWRFLAILGIDSAVISALALTFGKPIVLDINQIMQRIHIGGKPLFKPEPAQPQHMQPISQPFVEAEPGRNRVVRRAFGGGNAVSPNIIQRLQLHAQAAGQHLHPAGSS